MDAGADLLLHFCVFYNEISMKTLIMMENNAIINAVDLFCIELVL